MSVHGYNVLLPRTQKMRQSEAKAALQKIAGGGDADLTELLKDLAEWNNYTTDAIGGLINKVDARVQSQRELKAILLQPFAKAGGLSLRKTQSLFPHVEIGPDIWTSAHLLE